MNIAHKCKDPHWGFEATWGVVITKPEHMKTKFNKAMVKEIRQALAVGKRLFLVSKSKHENT